MVKSESDLRRMTKNELKQWLTKHDQRLPPNDKLKKYYVDRAISYFKLLQQEQASMNVSTSSNQSRSKIKHKGKVVSNSRTKKKLKSSSSSSSQSRTPTSIRKKIVKTQRRHSTIHDGSSSSQSPHPSLTKSKRKVIRVKRKTPTKQSPSLSRSIRKKRDRVRRATADPANLAKEIEKEQEENLEQYSSESDEDDDDMTDNTNRAESENGGDFNNYQHFQQERNHNLIKRKFSCSRDPEKMTIRDLQTWLDFNKINFETNQKKATYVNLVRKYSLPSTSYNNNNNNNNSLLNENKKKRDLSPKHKQNNSPKFKKPKTSPPFPQKSEAEQQRFVSPVRKNNDNNNPPLPSNLRRSPLTPQDDEKSNYRSRIHRENESQSHQKSGLLSTPALNKTGISRIDTPSKLAMRDEIRSLLGDTMDMNPVYPVKDSTLDSGITPGGPCEYDANVMNDVLSDLQKQQIEHDLNETAYNNEPDMDSKDKERMEQEEEEEEEKEKKESKQAISSLTWMNAIINRISPHKPTSQSIMKDKISSVLSSGNKINYHDTSIIRKGKRTIPSPASTEDSPVNTNNDIQQEAPVAYQDVNMMNNGNFRNDILIPPSPIDNYKQNMSMLDYNNNNNNNDDEDDMPQTPAIPHSVNMNGDGQEYNIVNPRRSPRLQKKNIFNNNIDRKKPRHNNRFLKKKEYNNSPGIIPSIPQQSNINQAIKKPQLSEGKTRCRSFGKFLFLSIIVGIIAFGFSVFDGMTKLNMILNEMQEFLNNIGGKEEILFCDTDKNTIAGLDLDESFECQACPKQAAFCAKGVVRCKTNFILQDNKCVLDGITVKFAFEIKHQVVKILSQRKGKYQCHEIDQDEGYEMSQDELIANIEIIGNERKKTEAFQYFKKNILPESTSISINENGKYFSHKTIKSPTCRIQEWIFENILGIIATFIVIVVVFAIWCRYKKKQREIQEIQDLTDEIYRSLEEYAQFEHRQHIAVDVVKQSVKPKNDKIWKEAEKLISKDARIQKSMRMIDGIQRKCWRASVTKIPNQNINKNIQWSPSQPQQQPQWNFNNNNNNNNNNKNKNNGGFNFMRSNQMQPNNFDDDRAETQTRFPPHSKHGMW